MTKSPLLSHGDILGEVIAPKRGDLPRAAARTLLEFRFDRSAVDAMNALAEKNRRGTLSAEERALMEEYARVGNFLNLVHAKARRSLKAVHAPL
jgi:hypothetical protein